jgi:hypothetical protein
MEFDHHNKVYAERSRLLVRGVEGDEGGEEEVHSKDNYKAFWGSAGNFTAKPKGRQQQRSFCCRKIPACVDGSQVCVFRAAAATKEANHIRTLYAQHSPHCCQLQQDNALLLENNVC